MDIQYSTDSGYQRTSINEAQSKSALVNFLINKHIAKNEGQANAILVAFIVIGFAITIYTIFSR